MFKPFKLSLLLMAFVMLLAITAPHQAHAQATVPPHPCDANSTWQNNYANNLATVAQARSTAAQNVFTGIPNIDVRLNYCMDLIKAMFDLDVTLSNPMGLITSLIRSEILALINQACQAAMSVVQQAIAFGLSQFNRFCLPLPNFMIGGINLGLKPVPCNGVNLLNPKVTQGPTPQAPAGYSIWNSKWNQ